MDVKAEKKIKITDPKQGLEKAMAWCTYQERCQQETRDKLYFWGLWKDAVENIIAELISQNFINEERFAKTYAGGKFRIKGWGRVKIKIELKRRQVSEYCIRKAMLEIDEDDYLKTLRKLLTDYSARIKEKHPLKKKYRVARYAQSRGFEQDLVWGVLGEVE